MYIDQIVRIADDHLVPEEAARAAGLLLNLAGVDSYTAGQFFGALSDENADELKAQMLEDDYP